MKKELELLRAFFNSLTDAICIISSDYRIVLANETFLTTYGLSKAEEVAGRLCHEVTHGIMTPCKPCLLEVSVSEKKAVMEHTHRGPNGEKQYVEVSFSPLRLSEKSRYVISWSRDITQHRREELEKKRMESELRVLEGLLPICAHCKKIRDDRGNWERIETYISERSKATFTHGMCPECIPKYFPPRKKKE